jgi:hypothetical protein
MNYVILFPIVALAIASAVKVSKITLKLLFDLMD